MNMTTVPSDKLKEMQQEIESLKEQLAQLRIEADFNFEQYQDAGRLLCELQAVTAQQAEAIRLKDVALRVAQLYLDGNCHSHKTVSSALAVQPSPEILQTRDEQVAEACAKIVNPSSLTYITRGDAITAIRSNEWRKYL